MIDIADNIKLVHYALKKYRNHHLYNDLIGEGFVGLCKASNSFDASKGISFSSYAIRCILNQAFYFLRKNIKFDNDGEYVDEFHGDASDLEMLMLVDDIKKQLTLQESNILFMISTGYTQTEIANKIGTSQIKISRIKNGIHKKLKGGEGNET